VANNQNSKISELVEIVDPSDTDYIPIVDTLNQETKKISYASLVFSLNEDDDSYSKTEVNGLLDFKAPIADPVFTGTATIPTADITTANITTADFNPDNLGGELFWNDAEKTLDLVTGTDNVTLQLGQEVVLYARNRTGATLSDGDVVMINGSQGNKPTIALAQADTVENARKTIGVVTQVIPNNSNGFVTLIGKVRGLVLDEGTYTEGDVVYLSSTVAGGLTAIEPDISVELGHVLSTSSGGNTKGVLEVYINNGAAVHKLEQVVNANTAANTENSSRISNIKEYPYTTSIENEVGITRNIISTDGNSSYSNDQGLTSICFGFNCTQVGSNTFSQSANLTEVFYSNSITGSIGNNCFQDCSGYINFLLGSNISAIGNSSYRDCVSLTGVDLTPYDVGSIGFFAFEGCTGLTSFKFPQQTDITQNIFTLIPESVLRNCTQITSIDIPASVTQINAAAFRDCSGLSTVNCYATTAPTLVGANQFLNTPASIINVPSGATTGWPTTYAGLNVSYTL